MEVLGKSRSGCTTEQPSCHETEEVEDSTTADNTNNTALHVPPENVLFSCPEDGCSGTFQKFGNLLRHIESGKHTYKAERSTMRDVAVGTILKH